MLNLLFILGVSIASPSDIVLETRYDFRTLTRFPVELFLPSINRYVSGYASLHLSPTVMGFSSGSSDDVDDTHGVQASEIRIANTTTLRYRYRVPINWDNEDTPTAHISADFTSDFLNQVGSYLITPVSHNEGLLVLNPTQPGIYAYNGELLYARSSHEEILQVFAGILVVPANRRDEPPSTVPLTSLSRCSIVTGRVDDDDYDENEFSSTERIRLPPAEWGYFVRELERVGLISESQLLRERISLDQTIEVDAERFEELVDELPSLQFVVELVNGSQAGIYRVEPRDYFTLDYDNPQTGRLTVYTSPFPSCELGKRFLKSVVMHVDGRNHMIGFGDPLIEF